jgi:hypothetical protein
LRHEIDKLSKSLSAVKAAAPNDQAALSGQIDGRFTLGQRKLRVTGQAASSGLIDVYLIS